MKNYENESMKNYENESASPLPPSPSRYSSLSPHDIFSSNINLVYAVVSKYKIRDSYVREEAVSVGMEELWRCIKRFQEDKGKFGTYAWKCVDGKVIVKKSIKISFLETIFD